ncbi:unnamed protein product [Urochloa humidicola]
MLLRPAATFGQGDVNQLNATPYDALICASHSSFYFKTVGHGDELGFDLFAQSLFRRLHVQKVSSDERSPQVVSAVRAELQHHRFVL